MKKIFLIAAVCAGLLCMTSLPSYAVLPLALEDAEYRVYMICTGDAGDYCGEGDFNNDTFKFESDDEFVLESFEDELWGLGDKGNYDDSGTSFSADYEAINDSGDKYEFAIRGFMLLDTILIGTMNIVYTDFEILGSDDEEEATAFFLAAKR